MAMAAALVLVAGLILRAQLGAESMQVRVDLQEGQELFLLKTKDNPVNRIRNTVLIRSVGGQGYRSNAVNRLRLQ